MREGEEENDCIRKKKRRKRKLGGDEWPGSKIKAKLKSIIVKVKRG